MSDMSDDQRVFHLETKLHQYWNAEGPSDAVPIRNEIIAEYAAQRAEIARLRERVQELEERIKIIGVVARKALDAASADSQDTEDSEP